MKSPPLANNQIHKPPQLGGSDPDDEDRHTFKSSSLMECILGL